MHFNEVTPERWKRIRDVASSLLDEPSDPDGLLERECAGDSELRDAVLHLAAEYSEAEELFGCEPLRLTSLEEPVPETPRRIGPYLIAREIGRGGMGAVYLATRDDGAYEKQVAIKTLPFGNRDQHRLFLRERQILAVLEHPGNQPLDELRVPRVVRAEPLTALEAAADHVALNEDLGDLALVERIREFAVVALGLLRLLLVEDLEEQQEHEAENQPQREIT